MDIMDVDNEDKQLVLDIDGVLTKETDWFPKCYPERTVKQSAKEIVNKLWDLGYNLVFHTARFRRDSGETYSWFHRNGIKVKTIEFQKPGGLVYIDDKAYPYLDNNLVDFLNFVKPAPWSNIFVEEGKFACPHDPPDNNECTVYTKAFSKEMPLIEKITLFLWYTYWCKQNIVPQGVMDTSLIHRIKDGCADLKKCPALQEPI